MNSLRTFIAIDIPIENHLNDAWNRLKKNHPHDSIKWVDPQILHLTLFFLGDITISKVDPIWNSICEQMRSVTSFGISLKGMGLFGSVQNPKVIWVGLQPSHTLQTIYKKTIAGLEPFGFLPDPRGFNPHITLGRIKNITHGKKLVKSINELRNIEFQETIVNQINFYKSELTPQGPIYTKLRWLAFP